VIYSNRALIPFLQRLLTISIGVLASGLSCLLAEAKNPAPYGIPTRPIAKPYMHMPESADRSPPKLLSQTGAFSDTPKLIPTPGLIPYDINVSFWSDGAAKARWVSVPNDNAATPQKIGFAPAGEWTFPKGTVFVKHFELPLDETQPAITRRLETRLLVCDRTGSVYGVTYKWRADNSDAELLATNLTEELVINTAAGIRTQTWYYPSRLDCRTCHTDKAGGVLGVKTRQMNCDFLYSGGVKDDQLRAWNHAGLFEPRLNENDLGGYAKLAAADDGSRSLEERARSYLDANCAQCHRPGGTVAYFDARYDTPLAGQGLIDGQILINEGLDNARVIAPNDRWRSVAFLRMSTLEALKMPPIAHQRLDPEGLALVRKWIESLPGPAVLEPPVITPAAGHYAGSVEVTLAEKEPGAAIRYTLDGSAPTKSDPLYEHPIKLAEPTVLRAKAFKPGFTKSITVQGVFMIGD
jgi:uncharacterized repeat protein (TIGR03806 family)